MQLKAQLEKLKQVRKACTHQWHTFVTSITCHLTSGPFRAPCSTSLPAPLQWQPEGRASWSPSLLLTTLWQGWAARGKDVCVLWHDLGEAALILLLSQSSSRTLHEDTGAQCLTHRGDARALPKCLCWVTTGESNIVSAR